MTMTVLIYLITMKLINTSLDNESEIYWEVLAFYSNNIHVTFHRTGNNLVEERDNSLHEFLKIIEMKYSSITLKKKYID